MGMPLVRIPVNIQPGTILPLGMLNPDTDHRYTGALDADMGGAHNCDEN